MHHIRFTDHQDVPQAEAGVVDAGLDAANQQARALQDVRGLSVFARTAADEVIGGAVGRTWGDCCELQELWVAPALRNQGLASTLLGRFEDLAAQRGCRLLYLYTFSFQAPDFYRKRGYQLAFCLRGFSQGVEKYLMQKSLAAG
ncbi:GNAT family N-acetyltransferase [Ideonella azotifigens]|uniref:N-acetyltransferase domain-containing protein n=1 Tax=Ideonella azotifigens TaxID=513160 RepID=A0ABN1KEX7_9BURK|nr:GNAT family N-acetyltransferase [Ideonella azotifigens]MCD2340752.1 GNAT family N-acetyltransferase [Ideonella azotifigens]